MWNGSNSHCPFSMMPTSFSSPPRKCVLADAPLAAVPGSRCVTRIGSSPMSGISWIERWSITKRDPDISRVAGIYRLSFLILMLYLAIYSNVDNKYLILFLALSTLIRQQAETTPDQPEQRSA